MNFITLDFETAKRSQESACAIGMVRYHGGEKSGVFYSLIRPPVLYIRPDFTKIHGLTVEDVRNAPRFDELWEDSIRPFIGDLPVAAHNAPFDFGVLRSVTEWYSLRLPELSYFCSLELSRKAWPNLRSHALTRLAAGAGIEYDAHNALADAETCGAIIIRAAERFNVKHLNELLASARMSLNHICGAGYNNI